MRLLLDTNVLIWALANVTFSEAARTAVADTSNDVFVSSVSPWEIAIKKKLGKLDTPDDLQAQLEGAGFLALAITHAHGLAAGALPYHHKDPFDRMLVAQARIEGMTLVTGDRRFDAYDVRVLAA